MNGLSMQHMRRDGVICRVVPLLVLALFPQISAAASRIKLSSTRVAQATVAGVAYDIFPETQNLDNPKAPNVWRFDVQPMFVVQRGKSEDGQSPGPIEIVETQYSAKSVPVTAGFRNDVRTRLIITLLVQSKELIDKSVDALNALYKPQGYTFTDSQISAIPLTQIDLAFYDLQDDPCKLLTPTIKLSGSESTVSLYFECLDHPKQLEAAPPLANVLTFRQHLPITIATISVTYDAKEADRASINVQSVDIKKTKFYADLSGKGDSVYVSRNDLRNLGIEASKELQYAIQGRKMTADELATCTTPQMMSFPETSIEWAQVTAETLSKTYNAKDLDPTEVNKELSEILDKGSSEDNVEINTEAHASGLWGLGDVGGKLSGKDFQKRASEHGISGLMHGNVMC